MHEMRILAVDHDPDCLTQLSNIFRQAGQNNVKLEQFALNALRLLRDDGHFECLLIDSNLTGINGIEFCRVVRFRPHYSNVPIIMVCDDDSGATVEAALGAGADDFLFKPLNEFEVKSRLRAASEIVAVARHFLTPPERRHVGSNPARPPGPTRLNDPDGMPLSKGVITYDALERHILNLGESKIFGRSVVAFRITNIEEIYTYTDASGFSAVLSTVASTIAALLEHADFAMAHGGRGEFVAVIPRHLPLQSRVLVKDIARHLQTHAPNYKKRGVPLPAIQVGNPMGVGAFKSRSPGDLLANARLTLRYSEDIPTKGS